MTPTRTGAWLEGTAAHWRVWAPEHKRVEVVIYDHRGARDTQLRCLPLTAGPDGYFDGSSPEGRADNRRVEILVENGSNGH